MDNPLRVIEIELEGERATALGDAGRRLEAALADLALGETEERLDEAGTAAWHFIILRESVRMHMMYSQHVVILRDIVRERYLPIWIGPWEANAIAMRLPSGENLGAISQAGPPNSSVAVPPVIGML